MMAGREVFGKEELEQVTEVLQSGVLFRYGFDAQRKGVYKVKTFEDAFARYVGARYALGVSSGTAALKTALEGLNLPKGSEILVPCFTFVASIEAIEETGHIPVLCEIDRSFNISVADMERRITKKTACILPVHMMGSACNMGAIMDVAKKSNLAVVEDACQATGASYRGKKLGTFGEYGCFSFDYVKVLTTGEGGMVVTDEEALYLQADYYHDHGHPHRTDIGRGFEERMRKGTNYRMNEIQGALGIAQLAKLPGIIATQKENKRRIKQSIAGYDFISFREHYDEDGEIATFLAFLLPDRDRAEKFKKIMADHGVTPGVLNYWHFIANIQSTGSKEKYETSQNILERSVVIEILMKMDVEKTIDALTRACKKL